MKKILFFYLCALPCFGQFVPTFKSLRYNEDYSALRSDSTPTFYKQMKFKPLEKNGNIL